MKNILVTGSAGFIASHLIEELLKDENNSIIGIDNFYSGTKENLDFIKLIDSKNKFEFIEVDIRSFDEINKIIRDKKIEYIYHLAAIVSVQESIENPLLSNEVNIKGTLNILEAIRLNNVKRVVFSSSAAVYGDEPTQPKNENSITKPISPYGYEKLLGLRNDIPELLNKSHCLLMPSLWEGLPMVILEAGASSLPIISTPVGSIPSIINENNGYLASFENFEKCIIKVLENYSFAKEKGLNLFKDISNAYSITSIVNEHENLYKSLLNDIEN